MHSIHDALDRIIARIASRQYGIVTAGQLVEVGVSREAIQLRAERGTLIRVHKGVYRVGHTARCTEADYIAATLACGRGSVLAGRALGSLYRVIGGEPASPEVVAAGRRDRPGIITRRTEFHPLDTTKSAASPASLCRR